MKAVIGVEIKSDPKKNTLRQSNMAMENQAPIEMAGAMVPRLKPSILSLR